MDIDQIDIQSTLVIVATFGMSLCVRNSESPKDAGGIIFNQILNCVRNSECRNSGLVCNLRVDCTNNARFAFNNLWVKYRTHLLGLTNNKQMTNDN